MTTKASGFEAEFRISTGSVSIGLVVLGVVLAGAFGGSESHMMNLTLLAFLGAAAAWILDSLNAQVGRWFTLMMLVALVCLATSWLRAPEVLTLMVVPIALATSLVGSVAAGVTALGESALLLLLLGFPDLYASPRILMTLLTAMWAVFGLSFVRDWQARQLSKWLAEYFERAQRSLSEARDSKAELCQALDRLAQANRQLALASGRMAALREIAEEARRTKTMFLAKVSHEFRTPLNMIIGLVSTMLQEIEAGDEVASRQFVEDLCVVQRNCAHLSDMIADVLDLSRIDAERFVLHRERVDLAEVIDSALAVVRPLLDKKRLEVQVTIPDELPKVYCDRVRIRQVVLNLLSNAARFTTLGSVSVNVEERDGQVRVRVADTGPGIAPEDVERVFEPFDQGGTQLWRDKGGSGLGLSVSRQFVKLHGGRMWLDSELGAGSRFFFELPISPPVEHVGRPGRWIKGDWIWREQAFQTAQAGVDNKPIKPRVIVCDETGGLCAQLVRCTDDVEFVDARDAAQVASALDECPAHAVLLNASRVDDVWSEAERIRRKTQQTLILGCAMPRQVTLTLERGAMEYLVKPVTPADLQRAIRALDRPVKRILVVDDDLDVLKLFTRMLHMDDRALQVITASSGEQALHALRAERPDLMLLDIVMPDLDGWQVVAFKNMDDAIRDIPVILVSGQDPVEQRATSPILMATTAEGLSLNQILRCSLALSSLLLEPAAQSGPAPG